ncbi:MAG: CAP domain-containing protein [Cyanobacteria bacterium J06597_16]
MMVQWQQLRFLKKQMTEQAWLKDNQARFSRQATDFAKSAAGVAVVSSGLLFSLPVTSAQAASAQVASAQVASAQAAAGSLLPLATTTTRQALSAQAQPRQVAYPLEILAEINRLRESPAAYAAWLETLRPYYEGAAFRFPDERGIRTVEGVAALDGAIAALSQREPAPALTLEPGLVLATQAHLDELLTANRFTLMGLDGSSPLVRAEQYGSLNGGRLNELLYEGLNSAEAIVAMLVIDDGNRSRTTQDGLLSTATTRLGVACGMGNKPLCVVDYATRYVTASDIANSIVTAHVQPVQAVPSQQAVAADPTPRAVQAVATDDSQWFGTPTAEQLSTLERDLMAETNRMRENPAAYAEELKNLRGYYEGNLVKVPGQPVVSVVEGVSALDEAIAALQSTPSLSPLAPSTGMEKGARDHAKDLGAKGMTGHYGSDSSDPFVRMNRYGSWDHAPGSVAGENISYGQAMLAKWHLIQLLVDDNVPSRGHREALLKPNYTRIGAACEAHAEYRIVCVMTYASDYREVS